MAKPERRLNSSTSNGSYFEAPSSLDPLASLKEGPFAVEMDIESLNQTLIGFVKDANKLTEKNDSLVAEYKQALLHQNLNNKLHIY